ncbi:methylated-DNA--protein-cysteine methyltransferase [Aquipluma nitroreducens]|uniref:Methylated-DNA--protein-cysteine methyltransferase n=1 Tax=Aquipluma nitroreducens TaxID=2010828 RepID=A0A5K7SBS2_9BACT|nr:methylated-DNA--[protein]-cysteine S-methyltransferase [Aquipluma nitroreducens]BBE19023.1 methylated-DNA--protein-cysteine methyltransferase [Aquipluma nitroreducens]
MQYQTSFSSPLGFLILKSEGQSVTEITFSDNDIQDQSSCELLENCKEQLQNYFSGKTTSFDLPLSPEGTEFQQKVWAELLQIPYGERITYMELAVRLGDPKCIRAAGTANGKNPIAIVIPCHRVIGAGNKLTGYAGGIWRKRLLLELEMKHNPSKRTLF